MRGLPESSPSRPASSCLHLSDEATHPMIHPKGKLESCNLAAFTPADASMRHSPKPSNRCPFPTHEHKGTLHKPRTRDHIYFTFVVVNVSALSLQGLFQIPGLRKGLLYAWPISGRSARNVKASPSVYVQSKGLSHDMQNGGVHFQSGSEHSLDSELKSVQSQRQS